MDKIEMQVKVLEMKAGTFEDDNGRSVTDSNVAISFAGRELKVKTKVDLKAE